MPLARYFLFVGGTLLTLLFFLDAYVPSPVAASAPVVDVGRPVVRIHSAQKLPERIVIDTSIPTIVPAAIVVADIPAKTPALDAFAQIAPQAVASELKKPEPKVPPKRRVARRQVRPPVVVAQVPRFDFDFFAHN
jgi:hypothetical protein